MSSSAAEQRGGGRGECDAFSKRPCTAFGGSNKTLCGATSLPPDVVVEIATSGARAPVRVAEPSATFVRGRSAGREGELGPATQQARKMFNSNRSATVLHKQEIRSTASVDGVRLTLFGVSHLLKESGVDHLAVARALVDSSVDLRTRNTRGMTPLHVACASGLVDVVKVLLLGGADAHARDHRSRCPLHMAALAGSGELVAALIACGANPNSSSDLGTTALHNAALLGRAEVCRSLLMAGADADTTDHNSFGPLYLASQNGHTQVVQDLLAAGADAGIKTSRGFTPLHVAARCGRLAVLRALLDAGVPVDCSSSPAGTTPLHLSAGFSRESCVMELLHRGADSAKENKRGATPLDMVGTLIPPCMDDPRASGRVKSAFENKLAQGMCVRIALEKAQAWQRRRMAVLLCEILRRRALENKTVAERDVSCAGEMHSGGRGGKRYKLSAGLAGTMEDVSHGGANDRRREEQGCVIVRLCAHPDAHLTRNVIRFL